MTTVDKSQKSGYLWAMLEVKTHNQNSRSGAEHGNDQVKLEPPFDAARSLHNEVLSRLRDYIVEGNLEDGARIPERELSLRFKISRTPLREALKVLSSEGLVELLPNRGSRVRTMRPADVAEVFDLIGGLEGLAGRLACETISDAEFAEIETLHHEMYGFYLRRNLPEYFRCNQTIHQKIVDAARNAALTALYATLGSQIKRFRYTANLATEHDRWSEAVREHEAILDALRRRSGDELSGIMFRHIRNKRQALTRDLKG